MQKWEKGDKGVAWLLRYTEDEIFKVQLIPYNRFFLEQVHVFQLGLHRSSITRRSKQPQYYYFKQLQGLAIIMYIAIICCEKQTNITYVFFSTRWFCLIIIYPLLYLKKSRKNSPTEFTFHCGKPFSVNNKNVIKKQVVNTVKRW